MSDMGRFGTELAFVCHQCGEGAEWVSRSGGWLSCLAHAQNDAVRLFREDGGLSLAVLAPPDDKDRVITALRTELEKALAWERRAREELIAWRDVCPSCEGTGVVERAANQSCRNCATTRDLLAEG